MSFTFPIQIANRTRFEITVSKEVPVTELPPGSVLKGMGRRNNSVNTILSLDFTKQEG